MTSPRRRRRYAAGLGLLSAVLLAAVPAGARAATFGNDVLASASATLQADYAYEPAVSALGADVVFTGSVGGVTGVFRRDLGTGELDVVAYGDAGSPSISANGRYVAFTTSDAVPGDPGTSSGQLCPQVYVRDMDLGAGPIDPTAPTTVPAAAYTLVSARDGSALALNYAGASSSGCPGGGAATATARAISADGNEVAFTTVGASDLTGPLTATDTPAAQVAVRYLSTQRTVLVSQTAASLGSASPAGVPHGATLVDLSTWTNQGNPNPRYANDPADSTAAISADGSTVAWLGINIPQQSAAASADAADGSDPQSYDEPLWRRIADGPSAPTRRILGGDDPSCGCSGPLDLQYESSGGDNTVGPYHGSFQAIGAFGIAPSANLSPSLVPPLSETVPALSANGQTVAVLSTQPLVGQEPTCPATGCSTAPVPTNAYVVNMAPGLTRAQAVTPITELGGAGNSGSATLGSLAISPEGDEVAFSTERVSFPLSPPTLITPPLTSVPGAQLYVADLADGTMSLASLGYDGQPANGPVVSTDFSDDGGPIAFATSAGNLVYGAASDVAGGDEIETTTQVVPVDTPGSSVIGALPGVPALTVIDQLGITAQPLPGGRVRVSATLPGPGSLRLGASGRLRFRVSVRHGRHRIEVSRLRTVTLAQGTATATDATTLSVTLSPSAADRRRISAAHGVYATIRATYTGADGTQTASTPVEFPAARLATPARGAGRAASSTASSIRSRK